jgi:cobalt-zinc-cadmium efflux system protein
MSAHMPEHAVDRAPAGRTRALAWALGLNGLFLVVEFVGGVVFGSLALLADAGHLVADVVSLGIAVAGVVLLSRPTGRRHSFGFARAEVLAAQASALLLAGGGVWVIVEALSRVSDPVVHPVNAQGLMAVALVGLVVNVASALVVHRAEGESLNMRAAVVHLATDAVGSVAALIAGVLIWVFGWAWADSLASVIVAALMLWSGGRLLAQTTHILMEGTPTGIDAESVRTVILEGPEVVDVHHLHLWNLASDVSACSAHVVLDGRPTLFQAQQTADLVRAELADRFGLIHVTLELEDEESGEPYLASGTPSQTSETKEQLFT